MVRHNQRCKVLPKIPGENTGFSETNVGFYHPFQLPLMVVIIKVLRYGLKKNSLSKNRLKINICTVLIKFTFTNQGLYCTKNEVLYEEFLQ